MRLSNIHQIRKIADADIVDQAIKTPEGFHRGFDHMLATVDGAQVARRRNQPLAVKFRDGAGDRISMSAIDCDGGTGLKKHLCGRMADTVGTSRHQDPLTKEIHEYRPP